jgi:hypothetical protein
MSCIITCLQSARACSVAHVLRPCLMVCHQSSVRSSCAHVLRRAPMQTAMTTVQPRLCGGRPARAGAVELLQACPRTLAPQAELLLELVLTLAQDEWPQASAPHCGPPRKSPRSEAKIHAMMLTAHAGAGRLAAGAPHCISHAPCPCQCQISVITLAARATYRCMVLLCAAASETLVTPVPLCRR